MCLMNRNSRSILASTKWPVSAVVAAVVVDGAEDVEVVEGVVEASLVPMLLLLGEDVVGEEPQHAMEVQFPTAIPVLLATRSEWT